MFQSMGWLSSMSVGSYLKDRTLHIHYLKSETDMWKCVMAQIKEISEDIPKTVIDAHQAENGFKTISKEFGLH